MRFHLPSALRRWAAGNEILEMSLPLDVRMTVSEAIVMLGRDYPAIRQRVLDDQNDIRRHVNVFVDGENVRYTQGGATQVSNDTEIWIYPALSGGCGHVDCRSGDIPNDYTSERRKR
jgi:sulfur-carrier protein